MKLIICVMLLTGLFCGAQEIPQVALHYTGDTGKFFRDWPVPPGTRYKIIKTTPDKLKEQLDKGEIRLAVTTVPLRKPGLTTVKFAYKATILAVHQANPLRNISLEQVRDLLEKNQGSWRTFGGPMARLHLYIKAKPELPPAVMRHDHNHGRKRPRTILEPEELGRPQPQEKKTSPSPVKYSQPLKFPTESDSKSFSMLSIDPLGMACFDITRYDENRVHVLSIERIPPTLENFRFGSYPLMTTYYLTVPEKPTSGERKLIDYLWSRKFAARLYRAGLLPEQRKGNDEKTAPAKDFGRSGFQNGKISAGN